MENQSSSSSTPKKKKGKDSCKRCSSLVDGVREHIEAYKKLLKYTPALPASYLIDGLLKIVEELEQDDDSEAEVEFTGVLIKKERDQEGTGNSVKQESGQDIKLENSRVNRPRVSVDHNGREDDDESRISSTSPQVILSRLDDVNVNVHRTPSRSPSHSGKSPRQTPTPSPSNTRTRESPGSGSLKRKSGTTSSNTNSPGGSSTPVKRALIFPSTSSSSPSRSGGKSTNSSRCQPSSSSSSGPGPVLKNPGSPEKPKKSLSPAQQALTEPEVLKTIFKFLPYEDLLVCQSVDLPNWSAEARPIISQRPLLNVCLSSKKPKSTMSKAFQDRKIPVIFQTMEELSSHLQTFEQGSEIWLNVTGADLSSGEVSKFLEKFSTAIYRLTLCYGSLAKYSPADFQKLLSQLPNLNYLDLPTIPEGWKGPRQLFPHQISPTAAPLKAHLLPQIKTISFRASAEFYPEFVKGLFELTPNLNNVLNFPIYCMKALTQGKKDTGKGKVKRNLGVIKSVLFSSSDRMPTAGDTLQRFLAQLEKVSDKTRLESAHLRFKMSPTTKSCELWKSCGSSLSKIFKDNQNTIKYLIIEPFPLSKFLKYPRMKAVKKIQFKSTMHWKKCENAGKVVKFFAEEFDVRRTFPNLVKVTWKGEGCALDEFLKFLPDDALHQNYFRGVTSLSLKFNDLEEVEALEKAAHLFSDVTTFSMDGDVRWLESRLTHILRLWPKLVKLKLRVNVVMTPGRQTIVASYPLDPIFTGLSEEKCNQLRGRPGKLEFNLKAHRRNLAIPDMTDLKELILIFDGNYAKTQKVIPLISHVTPFYGFQPLSHLSVTCAIPWDNTDHDKIRDMLRPIKKYVTFKTNYYSY